MWRADRRFYPELMSNIAVIAMVCIIVSFAVGVGNVEGFIISEIMPVYAKVRLSLDVDAFCRKRCFMNLMCSDKYAVPFCGVRILS